MSVMTSQITTVSIVCSTVFSGADQRKYQSSTSLAFVMGIHRWPVDSPHKGPVTRKMFPFDDISMKVKEIRSETVLVLLRKNSCCKIFLVSVCLRHELVFHRFQHWSLLYGTLWGLVILYIIYRTCWSLLQVMACYLFSAHHYLNQCWLIFNTSISLISQCFLTDISQYTIL